MPNKSVSERLYDCEKIQGDQQTELVKHSERLRDLEVMKKSLKLLATLREDFELVVQFSDVACRQIALRASGGWPHQCRTGVTQEMPRVSKEVCKKSGATRGFP